MEINSSKHIILASHSTRRKQLLSNLLSYFEIRNAGVDENIDYTGKTPEEITCKIAKSKALFLSDTLKDNEIIIAADTLVFLDNKPLGKASDRDEAISFLKKLSGKTHQVTTGVCILTSSTTNCFSETTHVTFKPLTDAEITHYVDVHKPYDKAGAYAIQGWIGMIGVTKIEGDYYNVVGLPINRVYKELQKIL